MMNNVVHKAKELFGLFETNPNTGEQRSIYVRITYVAKTINGRIYRTSEMIKYTDFESIESFFFFKKKY